MTPVYYSITLPGRFDSAFSGSSPAQGQTDGEDRASVELALAYADREVVRRGKGSSMILTMTADGWNVLAEYASTYAEVWPYMDDDARADARVAREVLRRVSAALGDEFIRPRFCPPFEVGA
jgi:hypothetical protein